MIKKFILLFTLPIILGFVFLTDGPYVNLPKFTPDANISRDEIPSIYKWNLTNICPSVEQWNIDIVKCQQDLHSLMKENKDLSSNISRSTFLKILFRFNYNHFVIKLL